MVIKSKCPYCGCTNQRLLLGIELMNAIVDDGIVVRCCTEDGGCENRYVVKATLNIETNRIKEEE